MTTGSGLIVAAPASSTGKTTMTLALLRAFRETGLDVRSAKAGPDYIDPAFHAAASGSACVNLDPWAMRPGLLRALYARHAAKADLVLVEGVMGLFDGARDGSGSTADLAALLNLPVVLVLDVSGQGASAAAVADGFRRHRSDVDIVGVIANRVGSASHGRLVADSLRSAGMPLLGAMPRRDDLVLPARHLGLVQAMEHESLEAFLSTAADIAARAIDLAALRAVARPSAGLTGTAPPVLPPLGQRIAVASDEAFAFCYPHVLDGWHEMGASILPFSPLADEAPDRGADAVYLPGGYPELHGAQLAANRAFRSGMREAAARGAIVYGECGGYMVLGRGLVDGEGAHHTMLDLLALECSFAERRLHLGYRRMESVGPSPFPGCVALRGHEFHYSSVHVEQGEPLFRVSDATGAEFAPAGLRVGTVSGSFLHVVDAAE